LLVVSVAGWIQRQQLDVIEFQQEQLRVYREKMKGKRLRFTDDERRRLAAKAKKLGRKALHDLETIFQPRTPKWPDRVRPMTESGVFPRQGRGKTPDSGKVIESYEVPGLSRTIEMSGVWMKSRSENRQKSLL